MPAKKPSTHAFGQRLVSTIFTQSNQYRVVLEAPPELQRSPKALENIYVTSTAGVQDAASRVMEILRARARV